MKILILLLCLYSAFANYNENNYKSQRSKREVAGVLDIVTNHALPIHTDVKPDGTSNDTGKVTAPEDSIFALKSLRKSWPLPSKLEMVRSISRVVTLAALLVSAGIEFFPLLKDLFYYIYNFMY